MLDQILYILMSGAMVAGRKSRIGWPKCDRQRDPYPRYTFLFELAELELWHEDAGSSRGISRDADDVKCLTIAVRASADAVVSGDRNLPESGTHEGIPMPTRPQFLEQWRAQDASSGNGLAYTTRLRRQEMSMNDPNDSRKAEPIARSWNRFQTHVLPAVLAEPTPEAVELANLSFYFGAIALLAILGAAIDGAENEEAVAFMRETLDAELTAFVKSREADLH